MDRRKMLALLGASPALVAGAPSYARTAPASFKEAGSSVVSGRMITAVNPGITAILATRIPLAPRLDRLDGKTIYLVDTDWGGMGQNGSILEEMQAWFAEHMPGVKTIIKIKKGNFVTDDPALWKEIADAKGDGVVLGVAG
ncbi:MAG TPA: hypothetical protein VEJ46_01185 [Candidatus Acidoferrum sp.]|nr:hypothetical protein [Candidatus Acidoferrum sp.]